MNTKFLINLAIAIAVGYTVIVGFRSIVSYQGSFEFEPGPIDGLRVIAGGEVSTGFDPLVGVSESKSRNPQPLPSNLCKALFKRESWSEEWGVPIASFSDYNCPYCRVQTFELAELMDDASQRFTVVWHELALLGEMSLLAAKAALAADRQGAYVAFQRRLMRSSFSPTPEYLKGLAKNIGIDGEQLVSDMRDPEILSSIESTKDLARHLRFIGTPGLVVGRTVVMGYMPIAGIEELIEAEAEYGVPMFCREK